MKKTKALLLGDSEEALRKLIRDTADKLLPKLTKRQQVGKFDIINERPEGMSFARYKEIRKNQTKLLKNAKR